MRAKNTPNQYGKFADKYCSDLVKYLYLDLILTHIRPATVLPLLFLATAISTSVRAQEPPTKVFEYRDIPLSWIFEEWRRRGNNANTYLCACDRDICDTRPGWPFRTFRTGQALPVLGEYNMNVAQQEGFICGLRQ